MKGLPEDSRAFLPLPDLPFVPVILPFFAGAGHALLCEGNDLAFGPTFSLLENARTRQGINRLAKTYLDAFIASYAKPPSAILLDINHSEN